MSRPLAERVQVGAYVDGMQDDPARLAAWEAEVGGRAEIASYYYGYGDVFPARTERVFSDGGNRKVLLSWDMGPTRFTEWSAGDHDAYLDQIAAAARAYPHEAYVRPWPEMNGDWQTFQPTADGRRVHGGTYAEFRQAWRYVVTYLRNRGADNLRWVFNPTADTYAETTPVSRIWPGAAYVDVLGLDGFNWGRGRRLGPVEVVPPDLRRAVRRADRAPPTRAGVDLRGLLQGAPDRRRSPGRHRSRQGCVGAHHVRPPGDAPTPGHRVVRRRQGTGLAGDLVPRLRPAVATGDGRSCFVAHTRLLRPPS